MKISEVIKELEQAKYKYGDIDVAVHLHDWGDDSELVFEHNTFEDGDFQDGEERLVIR